MAPQSYTIEIKGLGGRVAIGTMPEKFMTFWSTQGTEKLTEYMFCEVSDRPDFEELYGVEVPAWEEASNVIFAMGPFVERSSIEVTNDERGFVDGIGEEGLREAGLVSNDDNFYAEDHVADGPLLFSHAFEEVSISYRLNLSAPFDLQKLKVEVVTIDDDYEIIRCFRYDGKILSPDDIGNGPLSDKQSRLIYAR